MLVMLVMLVSACVSHGFTLLVVRWYGGTGDSGFWHPVETCGNDMERYQAFPVA